MKYLIFTLFSVLCWNVRAQLVIPDANFKFILINSPNTVSDIDGNPLVLDSNHDGEIQTSEALTVYGISIWPDAQHPVLSLTGIDGFTNLERLTIKEHPITSLDMSGNIRLRILESITNPVSNLNVLQNPDLDRLECPNNELTQIDISQNLHLRHLEMYHNHLSNLDVSSNANLEVLYVNANQLSSLDVSNNTHLTGLTFQNNQLSEIDLSNNPGLKVLYCQNNLLETVDLSRNPEMDFFSCNDNPLESFNIKNGSSLDIFSFSDIPNLQYICADPFEFNAIQTRISQYGYTNVSVNSACNTLGLNDWAAQNPDIFPNPAKTHVILKNVPAGAKLSISDLAGKLVYEAVISSEEWNVNTAHCNSGIYFVHLVHNGQQLTRKLIVEKN